MKSPRAQAGTLLAWVREDLDRHLEQIRLQTEHLAGAPEFTSEAMETLQRNLENLRLTLEALMLDGPAQVVGEMHAVSSAASASHADRRAPGFDTLLDALVVLPAYLDRMQAGHPDLPLLLLPVINGMRAARGADQLQENALFAPRLDVELPELEGEPQSTPSAEEPGEFARRMRRQYEGALLNWLQEQAALDLLAPLQGACETLVHRLERPDLRRMWWIATEVIDGVIEGRIANDLQLRSLLARLHLVLRKLSDGEEAAAETVQAITRALLFHVATARRGHAGLDRISKRFGLRELVPKGHELARAQGAISGQDRDLYRTLEIAVHDEFTLVKDALDLEMRTGQVEPERRLQCREALQRLHDTLTMLGMHESLQAIDALLPEFDASESATDEERVTTLMSVAGQLLGIESSLMEQIERLGEPPDHDPGSRLSELPAHEWRRIRIRVLNEAVNSVREFQEAVKNRLGGLADVDLEASLRQVAGALEISGETTTAALVSRLGERATDLLHGVHSEAAVPKTVLEGFTDAVAALELFLTAERDQQPGRDRFLDVLQARLDPPQAEAAATSTSDTVPEAAAEALTEAAESTAAPGFENPAIDEELRAIFLEEYEAVAGSLDEYVPRWASELADAELLIEIRRGFHTLKGSGRMVGAEELGDFAWQIENMLNALLDGRATALADAAIIVRLAQSAMPALKQRLLQQPAGLSREVIALIGRQASALAAGQPADWASLRQSLPSLLAGMLPTARPGAASGGVQPDRGGVDPKQLRELRFELGRIQALLEAVAADHHHRAGGEEFDALEALADALARNPAAPGAGVARALQNLLEAQSSGGQPFSSDAIWLLGSSIAQVQAGLAALGGETDAETPGDEQELIDQLTDMAALHKAGPRRDAAPAPGATGSGKEPPERGPQEAAEPDADRLERSEFIDIFLIEAQEVLGRCDALLDRWRDTLDSMEIVRDLQREFHTFKGGARMSGLTGLGDLSHAMESLLERIAGGHLQASIEAVQALEFGCDHLHRGTESVVGGQLPETQAQCEEFEALAAGLESVDDDAAKTEIPVAKDDDASAPVVGDVDAETPAEAMPHPPKAAAPPPVTEMAETVSRETGKTEEVSGQTYVRVAADLLDSLVNAAAEINILRARLEQRVGSVQGHLKEFDETIARLREQFRKLEMETESQIHSRYHQAASAGSEGFDPLELDRFSLMQQLSRALSESVADLFNLQELMDEAARGSEGLLTQQRRLSSELQEGLMQTRMVPFGSIAPRLRRVVRTAAKELDKKARLKLQVAGSSDLIDRNVLERITVPLEHMLRNSIAHGIEPPGQRKKAAKSAEGQVTVTVESEATEFIIRVEDDGAGIDLKAVRRQAVKQGLLKPKAEAEPRQLLHFILDSGFTTSRELTGLAGRGVGMDVVNSEIKQMGGSLDIESESGQGTRFTIRIPFTLAIMQAIGMVGGEHRYLVPLTSVAAVARISPRQYRELAGEATPCYQFGDEPYPLMDLETLLGEPVHPLRSENVSLLVVRAGDQRAAIRVPELTGHREIVVKPVGPHIAGVPGILGGTVTADGRVEVILDPGPLIGQALERGLRPDLPAQAAEDQPVRRFAMVVDDSITMRKVNSRVLESMGFRVATARDGLEATEQLQEEVPDIMLLDIEMPRMDGYELAEYMRGESRFNAIPIIMITSRSGQKHRDRAEQAGANAYLTKPYKETELVREINRLLGQEQES